MATYEFGSENFADALVGWQYRPKQDAADKLTRFAVTTAIRQGDVLVRTTQDAVPGLRLTRGVIRNQRNNPVMPHWTSLHLPREGLDEIRLARARSLFGRAGGYLSSEVTAIEYELAMTRQDLGLPEDPQAADPNSWPQLFLFDEGQGVMPGLLLDEIQRRRDPVILHAPTV